MDDFTPTAACINALPEPLRRYIHDLETNCDPAGEVAAITLIRDQNKQLQARIEAVEAENDRLKERYCPKAEKSSATGMMQEGMSNNRNTPEA